IKVIPDIRNVKNLSHDQQKAAEAQAVMALIQPSDVLVIMDENGKQFTSRQFADYLAKMAVQGTRRLLFLIGGPYGFDKSIYDRANFKISLSPMTFSHQMVRLIFLEQLYRAHTIIKGQPYHHD
ncbi:MAG: 23S rRNA (pseudouridine(1915)-N(3))-methyltransferase RlmH, partial [Marinilabiliaceae bacterium]|nr:23S rRNA (pseudouridine(1915)-N(3))-methyltransferase RlmH [Marinilabiliaceae bacterium]